MFLKKVLWDLFEGDEYYKTDNKKEYGQASLFTSDETRDISAKYYSKEARNNLLGAFAGQTVSYNQMANYVIENSLLVLSQTLEYVIKPLVKEHKLIKMNVKGKLNFKEDNYIVKE